MPRNYQRKEKLYTDLSISTAVAEVQQAATVYKTAKKYHCSISMLRKRVLEANGNFTRKKQGRKKDIPPETEEALANCIRKMSELGMGIIIDRKCIPLRWWSEVFSQFDPFVVL